MSFGGGESPSGTQFQTQFTRDAPQIEAAKMGLMGTAQQYARFGQNPWELSTPGAKVGDAEFGKYTYQGPAGGAYAPGTKWEDLTRAQRAQEGQVDVPQQQVAGFNPQQQQAFGLASSGLGAFQPYLNTASQYAQAATGAYDPTGQTAGQVGYQDYMNPYQQHVTAGIESQFQKLQNQASAQAGQVGAFGGARQGVQSAELGRQQAESVGQSLAQNYGQAQQQAQQQFAGQMGRYGQAATQMAGLGGQQQQQQQGDIASLMASGSVQQQRAQQIKDAEYRQGLQQMYEPYQRLGFVSDIYQGMPSSAMATAMGTSPGTSPLAQAVGTGITGLAAYQGYQNLQGG
jgi:flagellar motility protein MotE (MotC chaperone)